MIAPTLYQVHAVEGSLVVMDALLLTLLSSAPPPVLSIRFPCSVALFLICLSDETPELPAGRRNAGMAGKGVGLGCRWEGLTPAARLTPEEAQTNIFKLSSFQYFCHYITTS